MVGGNGELMGEWVGNGGLMGEWVCGCVQCLTGLFLSSMTIFPLDISSVSYEMPWMSPKAARNRRCNINIMLITGTDRERDRDRHTSLPSILYSMLQFGPTNI